MGGWMGPRADLDTVEKRKYFAPAGNLTLPSSQYPSNNNNNYNNVKNNYLMYTYRKAVP
jgi:hypothetical protein